MTNLLIQAEPPEEETRVASTPETIRKFKAFGCNVAIESGAGIQSGYSDEAFQSNGAEIISQKNKENWGKADLVLCVNSPTQLSLKMLKPGALVVGLLAPYSNTSLANSLESGRLSAMSLELLPRISRAQAADALSSQANISGYKAVLIAAAALDRYFPMLMTAAGTVQPAKVIVLGAGVAGLQAIATAKRLGAVVYVSDIREAVKEQVESLGGRFIAPPEVDNSFESGGYAKEVSEAFLSAQRQKLSDLLAEADVAICTAQVPGKKAPTLIDEAMLDRMRSGSVVIDLAVEQGGNCVGTQKEQTILRKGVKLIGASNLASSVPNHASSLYSKNLLALLEPMLKNGRIDINLEDELIAGCLISHEGSIRHPNILNKGGEN